MIKAGLLTAFFLTLALDELLSIGLLIVPGLSAKNAFLFVLLIAILCSKAIDRSKEGVQFPAIHLLFLLLIADALLSIFYMHFVSGETAGFGLFGHIASVKSNLADMYLMFLAFFYGLDSRKAAVNFAKMFLAVVSLMSVVALLDTLNVISLGVVEQGPQNRLVGPLGGPNEYGRFLAFFIPILAVAAFGVGGRLLRVLFLVGATVSFALLVQTGSRGAFAGLLGGLFLAAYWLWGNYDSRSVLKVATVCSVLATGVIIVALMTSADVREIIEHRIAYSTMSNLDEASAGRTWIWAQGVDYQMARPWTVIVGVGWATFLSKVGMDPHSTYLYYFFSIGVIGLGLFVTLVYSVLNTAKRAFISSEQTLDERLLIGGLIIGWFSLVVSMLTGTVYQSWVFVWPFTGICFRVTYCLLSEISEKEAAQVASARANDLNIILPKRTGKLVG